MQSADDVQFRDANFQRLARFLNNFLDGKLKAVRVAFLARERAKLAGQNAIIGIIDVAIDDVARTIADFELPRKIRNRADGVQIFRLEQSQRGAFRNALARNDFVVDVAQFAALNEKIHTIDLTEIARLAKLRLMPFESALKNHFGGDDDEKNCADERVEAEEREVDPVQTAAARNPMFQHKATDDDQPANNIC